MEERRKSRRIDLVFHALTQPSSGGFTDADEGVTRVEAKITNLTLHGAGVISPIMAQIGSHIGLSVPLEGGAVCDVDSAKVVHARPIGSGYHIGVSFESFRGDSRHMLEGYFRVLKLLQKTPLLNGLTPDEIRRFLGIAEETLFVANERIFQEGDPADALYVVTSGVVKILMKSQDGREEPLALLKEGEVFGEMALLDQYPRAASAVAQHPTTALRIKAGDFAALMSEEGQLANKLLWMFVKILCHRLRDTDKKVVEMFLSPLGPLNTGWQLRE